MIVFMFSGQGSQYYKMGIELYQKKTVFKECMLFLDEIVQDCIGESVIGRIYSPDFSKSDPFDELLFTHTGIFMVEYSLAQLLISKGVKPDMVLGSSLGEYVAAAIAGVMPPKLMMELIAAQAKLIYESPLSGGMLALLGERNKVDELLRQWPDCELAAINYENHHVISGSAASLDAIAQKLSLQSVFHQRLPVNYAFHSSSMDAIKDQHMQLLRKQIYSPPRIPLISCANNGRSSKVDENYFWEVVRNPISFQKAIEVIESKSPCYFLDLGPTGTLNGFVKNILKADAFSKHDACLSMFGADLKNIARIVLQHKSFMNYV